MSTGITRLFYLKWDNSKMQISPAERYKKRACVGVHFAKGFIALENGACFSTIDELKHHLDLAGKYKLTYEGWQKVSNAEQEVSDG